MVNATINKDYNFYINMTKAKKYWKGLAELNNDPIVEKLAQNEFVEDIPVDDF